MLRDRRPIVIAGVTALVSCGLLTLAIWQGWLGADVGRGADFCEAARDWAVKQPANTFSNLAFVIAGLAIAWHGRTGRLAIVMAPIVVLLGPASAAMHATQSDLGGRLDMLSMYLVASFAAAYAIMRVTRRGLAVFAVAFLGGIAACEIVEAWGPPLPVVMTSANAAFGTLLVLAAGLELVIMRRREVRIRRAFGFASLACLLVAFGIWNATNAGLCEPGSLLQGHAVWHILDAVAAYLLYRYYASEETMRRIGVTGHIRIAPESVPMIRDGVRAALSPYAGGGFTGVSCIAAGADSVFAEEVLGLGGRLEVILPAADYRTRVVGADHAELFDRLLERAASVKVMQNESGPEAYRAANEELIETIDVLIAIWDGQDAAAIGGTAATVSLARAKGIPVVVVWPEGAARVVSAE